MFPAGDLVFRPTKLQIGTVKTNGRSWPKADLYALFQGPRVTIVPRPHNVVFELLANDLAEN